MRSVLNGRTDKPAYTLKNKGAYQNQKGFFSLSPQKKNFFSSWQDISERFHFLPSFQRVLPRTRNIGLYLETSVKGSTQNPLCEVLQRTLLWCNGSIENPIFKFYPEPFHLLRGPRRTHSGSSTENLFAFFLQNTLRGSKENLYVPMVLSRVLHRSSSSSNGFILLHTPGFYREPFYIS